MLVFHWGPLGSKSLVLHDDAEGDKGFLEPLFMETFIIVTRTIWKAYSVIKLPYPGTLGFPIFFGHISMHREGIPRYMDTACMCPRYLIKREVYLQNL